MDCKRMAILKMDRFIENRVPRPNLFGRAGISILSRARKACPCYPSHALAYAALWVCILFIPACQCDSTQDPLQAKLSQKEAKEEELLVFPEELYVTDISVNLFVIEAMEACSTGDYDAFRLLWSVQQDPLTREEFNQGWQATRKIRIRALERVLYKQPASSGSNPPSKNEMVFVLMADVELDPTHPAGQRKPKREAVLMIMKEQNQWRLVRATDAMRSWVKNLVESKEVTDAVTTHHSASRQNRD